MFFDFLFSFFGTLYYAFAIPPQVKHSRESKVSLERDIANTRMNKKTWVNMVTDKDYEEKINHLISSQGYEYQTMIDDTISCVKEQMPWFKNDVWLYKYRVRVPPKNIAEFISRVQLAEVGKLSVFDATFGVFPFSVNGEPSFPQTTYVAMWMTNMVNDGGIHCELVCSEDYSPNYHTVSKSNMLAGSYIWSPMVPEFGTIDGDCVAKDK